MVHRRSLASALAGTLAGCYTGVSDRAPQVDGGADAGAETDAGDAETGVDASRPDPPIGEHHTALGLRRLSKFEYGNTVRDLLGVDGADAPLPIESKIEFLSTNAHAKRVGLAELEAFATAAEDASTAALDGLALDGCTPDTATSECVATFLAAWLPRALRRPATTEELARYGGLFDARVQAGDPPREALRLVLEAVLMSPHFLYRRELGASGASGEPGPLDAYEIASRLSYLLWATMPDDALFAAAASDALMDPELVEIEVRRMLADPRAATGVVRFTSEWLGFDETEVVKKSADVLGGLPDTLQEQLEEETRRFVADAMLGPSHSLHTLLASPTTFANDTVASIYGLTDVVGPEFRPVELDPATRRGVLTQPLLLAAHTKEAGFSVVQMGRFVRERLLCQTIAPPPQGVDTDIDTPTDAEGLTYRELLEQLTQPPSCAPCHRLLNAPGFAYMSYDPIGRHVVEDALGRPLDSRGTLADVDGSDHEFTDAVEMIDVLAESPTVRACFARRYLEYGFGRTLAAEDVPLYHALADGLDGSDGDFAAFVAALVTTPEFASTGPFE